VARLDNTTGLPAPDWAHAKPDPGARAAGVGIPEPFVLQGRPLDALVAALPAEGASAPPHEAGLPPLARHGIPAGQGVRPSGAPAPALREPSGPSREWALPSAPDFRAQTTGFYQAWGTPPDSLFFRWDPDAAVYRPWIDPSQSLDGVEQDWAREVMADHLARATSGVFLQAYREGGPDSTGPWLYRWVDVEEAPYRVLGSGYESFGYRGPSVEDLRQKVEREREAHERMLRAAAHTDWGAAARRWTEGHPQ